MRWNLPSKYEHEQKAMNVVTQINGKGKRQVLGCVVAKVRARKADAEEVLMRLTNQY